MSETRKIAAILVSDVVGYSRLTGADEDRILARLRAIRSDLIVPIIAVHHGRVVKRTGDGAIVEFRSVVDAVRLAIEVQHGMIERNAGVPAERRIEFRIGIHLGDVVEESDGDLMGDGVNIAARVQGLAEPGGICLSEDAYRHVRARLDLAVTDLGPTQLKNIAEPMRLYSLEVGKPAQAKPAMPTGPPAPKKRSALMPLAAALAALLILIGAARGGSSMRTGPLLSLLRHRSRQRDCPLSCCLSPTSPTIPPKTISPTASPRISPPNCRASTTVRHRPQHRFHLQGQEPRRQGDRQRARRALRPRRLGAARRNPGARQRATH
jgi:class 3 adenylate cyclase